MKNQQLEEVWVALCNQIETYENVDVSQFKAFFSRVHPMAMSTDFLMLTADNNFIKSWVELNYLRFIYQGLEDLFGNAFTVLIEVDPHEEEIKEKQKQAHTEPSNRKEYYLPSSAINPTSVASVNEREENIEEIDNYVLNVDTEKPLFYSSFENFVLGDSNRLAYSMAVNVAENPGKSHLNPLFIYGKSGIGKTHLLLAIKNYINETQPNLSTIYVDSAEFVDDYVFAGRSHEKETNSYMTFKKKYEEANVLLIDDVQFFTGKTGTLDIVFQILNKRMSLGKQTVFSADRAPKNIDIDERYRTRFMSGGTINIQPPELETKLGIIKCFIEEYRKADDREDFDIPNDIQIYVAEVSSSNIRELKAAITKIIFHKNELGREIELTDVQALLENHFSGGVMKRITIDDIQKAVESFYKVNHTDLVGKSRTRDITHARYIAIYLCKLMLDKTQNEIAKKFNRDHATIIYAINNMEDKVKKNREIQEEIENIMKIIKEE